MEHKHFSHLHNLSSYQVPQGSEILCSGCKFPGTGSVYVCWQCKFFLHEQCYSASRSMVHPSHDSSHPLTLLPFPTHSSHVFLCDSCEIEGKGFSYSCMKCDFDLHVHCAYQLKNAPKEPSVDPDSNEVPQRADQPPFDVPKADNSDQDYSIKHKSHPHHHLKFGCPPPYPNCSFTCNSCGEESNDCTFNCNICNYDLHIKCASLPDKVIRKDHKHPLVLHYSAHKIAKKGLDFFCDVCEDVVDKDLWVYYCKKCDFGTHTRCVLLNTDGEGEPNVREQIGRESEKLIAQMTCSSTKGLVPARGTR